jgi:hypothetical protein
VSGRFEGDKIRYALKGIETQFLGCSARNLIVIRIIHFLSQLTSSSKTGEKIASLDGKIKLEYLQYAIRMSASDDRVCSSRCTQEENKKKHI